jgi:hypothetical protein
MKKVMLQLVVLTMLCCIAKAQLTAVRQVVAGGGRDTLIGTTIWAFTVGEPVVDSYFGSNLTLTQGFHQPDGYAITPIIPLINSLVIYPNPARPKSTLSFYLKADKPFLNIAIYDAQGKLFQNQTLESYAGQTLHSLNPQIMAAGTYTVKVTAGTDVYTGRFVIAN